MDINKKTIKQLLGQKEELYNFIEEVSIESEVIFFGGSMRDLSFNKEYVLSRDYDVVIDATEEGKSKVEELIHQYHYERNRFDGYKIEVNGVEVDLWFIEDTWAFREGILPVTQENLQKSVYLTIDAIAYNYNKGILYNKTFLQTVNGKEIGIVLDEKEIEPINLLRAIVYGEQYGMSLSDELTKKYRLTQEFIEELYQLQEEHYQEELYTQEELYNKVASIIE